MTWEPPCSHGCLRFGCHAGLLEALGILDGKSGEPTDPSLDPPRSTRLPACLEVLSRKRADSGHGRIWNPPEIDCALSALSRAC